MLALPPLAYRETLNNLSATPNTTNPGVNVTSSATIHTKGAWSTLIAATGYDSEWLHVMIGSTGSGTTLTDTLVDIGIGAASAEQVLIPDILAGYVGQAVSAQGRGLVLPIRIPKGSRLSARAQSIQASKVIPVLIWITGGARSAALRLLVGCDAIGITSSGNSRGTSVLSGNSGTEGSWTSIGAPTTRDYWALSLLVQGTNTIHSQLGYHLEVGINSTTIMEYFVVSTINETIGGPMPMFPILQPIVAGTQLQVRGECSGTAEALSCALYALY